MSSNYHGVDINEILRIESDDKGRIVALKKCLLNAIEKMSEIWKPNYFVKRFPSVAAHKKADLLEAIRKAVIEKFRLEVSKMLMEEISDELKGPLEDLSVLINECEAPVGSKAWRPSGNPQQDMLPHDMKILQYEKKKVLAALQAERGRVDELRGKVLRARQQLGDNDRKIEGEMLKMEELKKNCDTTMQYCERVDVSLSI